MRHTIGLLALLLVVATIACGGTSTSSSSTASDSPTPATFTTADNVGIQVNLYGHGTTAIILCNMSDNNVTDWDPIPTQLAQHGYAVLTFSYRNSTDVSQYVDDLLGAITYTKHQGARKIVLMGASMGGLVAAKAALAQPVDALIILSSPTSYGDLSLSANEAGTITIPKFVAYATNDANAATTPAFYQILGDPKTVKTYAGSDHGAFLIVLHPDLLDAIIQFLKQNGAGA